MTRDDEIKAACDLWETITGLYPGWQPTDAETKSWATALRNFVHRFEWAEMAARAMHANDVYDVPKLVNFRRAWSGVVESNGAGTQSPSHPVLQSQRFAAASVPCPFAGGAVASMLELVERRRAAR